MDRIGAEIRDVTLYDSKHDKVQEETLVQEMEISARIFLEGIRRVNQDDPEIKNQMAKVQFLDD